MTIFLHIEYISHKYVMKVNFSHKWAYFTQKFNESQIFTQMAIFSHIEHVLHNHFATFRCGLDFFEFFYFFMVVIA
jgi:hypothetical protein